MFFIMKYINYLLNLVTLVICIMFLVFFLMIKNERVLVFQVITNSMMPYINAGDFILVSEVKSYEKGDVVAYRDPNTQNIFTHRIVDLTTVVAATAYITKGDYNENIDPIPVLKHEIIGKHILTLPKIINIWQSELPILVFFTLSGLTFGNLCKKLLKEFTLLYK